MSQDFTVRNASRYALGLLRTHTHGTVHSVYRKTINLLLGEALVSLQAAASPLSPVSLITGLTAEQMAALPVRPDMPVAVTPGEILIGAPAPQTAGRAAVCRIRLAVTHPVSLLLHGPLSKCDLRQLETHILEALSLRDAGSFELLFTAPERAGEFLFLTAAQKRLAETESLLWENSFREAARSLRGLIGLGIGLTPGGDDFLCGVLAGLTLCGLRRHPFAAALSDEISAHLSDTNKISAAFLACALENQFSQAINELRPCDSARKILHVFREIGHSSGTDSLCGVFFLLHLRSLF